MKHFWKKIMPGALLLLLLSGCGAGKDAADAEKIHVVTSFTPIYLLAQEVTQGAEGITLSNMAQPQTGCLHDYEMTIADRKLLERADVFIINGGGMESFLDEAVAQYPDLKIIDTSVGIDLLEEDGHTHHGEETPEEHAAHTHGEGNPHIWLSPARAAMQAETICAALEEMDAQESALFAENTAKFRGETEELLAEAAALALPEGTFAAIFHEGFGYLAELCGMEPAVEIFADEYEEPSAKELIQAADEAKLHGIQYFLAAEDTGAKYGAVLAAENGEKCILLDPLTTQTDWSFSNASYIERMRQNIETISAYGKGETK